MNIIIVYTLLVLGFLGAFGLLYSAILYLDLDMGYEKDNSRDILNDTIRRDLADGIINGVACMKDCVMGNGE